MSRNKVLIHFLHFSLAIPRQRPTRQGQSGLHRGAHSTCKLILEMCAGFLILKLLNPHVLYIYMIIIIIIEIWDFICMLPFQLVIYDKWNVDLWFACIVLWWSRIIYIYEFQLFYWEFPGFLYIIKLWLISFSDYEILYMNYGFKMKLGRTGYLMGFIRTYAHR